MSACAVGRARSHALFRGLIYVLTLSLEVCTVVVPATFGGTDLGQAISSHPDAMEFILQRVLFIGPWH